MSPATTTTDDAPRPHAVVLRLELVNHGCCRGCCCPGGRCRPRIGRRFREGARRAREKPLPLSKQTKLFVSRSLILVVRVTGVRAPGFACHVYPYQVDVNVVVVGVVTVAAFWGSLSRPPLALMPPLPLSISLPKPLPKKNQSLSQQSTNQHHHAAARRCVVTPIRLVVRGAAIFRRGERGGPTCVFKRQPPFSPLPFPQQDARPRRACRRRLRPAQVSDVVMWFAAVWWRRDGGWRRRFPKCPLSARARNERPSPWLTQLPPRPPLDQPTAMIAGRKVS